MRRQNYWKETNMPTTAEWIERAHQKYAMSSNNDIEIAQEIADPIDFNTSEGEDGTWVLAWVWVPKQAEDEVEEEEDD